MVFSSPMLCSSRRLAKASSVTENKKMLRAAPKYLILFAAAVVTPVASNAAGQSYMSLVGELVGEVESLRMLKDICAHSAPETATQNARAYEAWAKRNDALLVSVQTQRRHADVRLAKQAEKNPGAPKSTEEIIALLQERLATQLSQVGPQAQKETCAKYPELISSSEEARTNEILALLKTVTHADEVLTQREAQ
jgi:hypothetical protein